MFVHPPKRERAPGAPLRCTTNPAPVIVDAAIGVAAGVMLASTISDPMPPDELGMSLRRVQQAIYGTTAVADLGSAIYGIVATERCRRAFDAAR